MAAAATAPDPDPAKSDPAKSDPAVSEGEWVEEEWGEEEWDEQPGRRAGQMPVPRWVPWLALVLSVIGLGDATYLTYDHFTGTLPVCANHGLVNCQAVTTSPQSHVFGIPVSVLGLAFFLAMVIVNLPPMWRTRDVRVHWARLALAVIGMGTVFYLLVAELVIIKAICLWCTGVHIVTFLLFVLVVATIHPLVRPDWGGGDWDDGDWDGRDRAGGGGR